MTNEAIAALGDMALSQVIWGARAWLKANTTLAPDMVHYGDAGRRMIDAARAALPEALADAKEAVALGMEDVAVHTFGATMRLAGIEAAKKLALHPSVRD